MEKRRLPYKPISRKYHEDRNNDFNSETTSIKFCYKSESINNKFDSTFNGMD